MYFVNKTIDGGIILAGDAPSNDVFKLNSDGQVQWKRSYPLSGECCQPQLSSLTYTSDGGILLDFYYDYFGYRVPCGMCIGCFGASGKDPDNYQIRVFKLDAFGNQQWTKCLGPNRPKSAMAFKSVDLSQTVTLVVGKTDVGGNNGSVIGGYNGKTGVNDVYITGLTNITTGIIPIPNTQTSKIYPNPSNNEIFIEYKPLSLLNKPEVIFRDIHGKILLKKILYKEKNVINIKHFTTGIYMVTIKDGVAERSMTIFKNE